MITFEKLSQQSQAFSSLTGMNVTEFHALFVAFTQAQDACRAAATTTRRHHKPRQRRSGAGRRFAHSEQTRLLMALVWLRIYPTFEVLGFFFTLHKSNAQENVADVRATRESLCDFAFERPAKQRKALGSGAAVMDAFADVALIIDAKEQRASAAPSETAKPPQEPQRRR